MFPDDAVKHSPKLQTAAVPLTLMKFKFLYCFLPLLALSLAAWGPVGHQAVALIAERHLSPEAQAGIKTLLGHEHLDEVSTWADEIKSDPAYKATSQWHYVNLPLGLSFEQFAQALQSPAHENVYTALQYCKRALQNPKAPRVVRQNALKFIVHLVGDMHQPMHVSRVEDQGGNHIELTFNRRNTNLHSLWDSGLLEQTGLTARQLAEQYDATITPEQITKWQHDAPMLWLWESYQISTLLYQETEQNKELPEDYYQQHIPVVQRRIAQAGIRLAGVLNEVFKGQEVVTK